MKITGYKDCGIYKYAKLLVLSLARDLLYIIEKQEGGRKKEMIKITLYRSDFRTAQDGSEDSMFEVVLHQLGIPKNQFDDIDDIELTVEEFDK